jgi:anaerobic ribonucleoside-triphosphate reductase activating protein
MEVNKMNYADIKYPDIANGQGVRVSLFVSGCNRHCKECFNPEAQNFEYGKSFTEETLNYLVELLKPDYVAGLSLLGGEPLELDNAFILSGVVNYIKSIYPNKTIWCYTGDTFEKEVTDKMNKYDYVKVLLESIDVLVDGDFQIDNKQVGLAFKGSSNQRIIDVQKTLKEGNVVLYDLYKQ